MLQSPKLVWLKYANNKIWDILLAKAILELFWISVELKATRSAKSKVQSAMNPDTMDNNTSESTSRAIIRACLSLFVSKNFSHEKWDCFYSIFNRYNLKNIIRKIDWTNTQGSLRRQNRYQSDTEGLVGVVNWTLISCTLQRPKLFPISILFSLLILFLPIVEVFFFFLGSHGFFLKHLMACHKSKSKVS